MFFLDPGWLRPLLAFALVVLGVILRFTIASRIGGFGLRRFRTGPDEDISVKVRERVGEMLLVWAGWLVVQIVVGVPESWLTAVWAPLVIIIALAPSYTARLYARRYLAERGQEKAHSFLSLGGWLWIILREAVPLTVILIPILIIRNYQGAIPEEIPVGWDFGRGDYRWMERESALDLLRHRTMVVYGILFGLEGLYLIVAWMRDRQASITERMLARPHSLYSLFKLGWVLLFAGLNLGFVDHAWGGRSFLPFLLPGVFTLAALAILVGLEFRQGRPRPPAR
jgi:biotin transporter BioY